MSSKMFSRTILPLTTQLRATPPARQRKRLPVEARAKRASLSMISSVTTWIERAMSISRRPSSLPPLRPDRAPPLAGRPAEEVGELVVGHLQIVEVPEVVEVQVVRAVLADLDQ